MKNVTTIGEIRERLDRKKRVDFIENFCKTMVDVAHEQTQLKHSLLVIVNGIINYIDDIPSSSFWAWAAVPAIGGGGANTTLPTEPPKEILIKFGNGCAGIDPAKNPEEIFGLGWVKVAVSEDQPRFAKKGNNRPVDVFLDWVEIKADLDNAAGFCVFFNQVYPFARILKQAYKSGFLLDDWTEEGDKITLRLYSPHETITMLFNYDHLRKTTAYLESRLAEENEKKN